MECLGMFSYWAVEDLDVHRLALLSDLRLSTPRAALFQCR